MSYFHTHHVFILFIFFHIDANVLLENIQSHIFHIFPSEDIDDVILFSPNIVFIKLSISSHHRVISTIIAFDEGERILIMSFFKISPVGFTRRSCVYQHVCHSISGFGCHLGWMDGLAMWHR